MTQHKIVQASLRLPAPLHARLKALADSDRRSLHAEMLVLLEEAITAREEAKEQQAKIAA